MNHIVVVLQNLMVSHPDFSHVAAPGWYTTAAGELVLKFGLGKRFSASPVHGDVNFAQSTDQARAMWFLGRECSKDDGNSARTAS